MPADESCIFNVKAIYRICEFEICRDTAAGVPLPRRSGGGVRGGGQARQEFTRRPLQPNAQKTRRSNLPQIIGKIGSPPRNDISHPLRNPDPWHHHSSSLPISA